MEDAWFLVVLAFLVQQWVCGLEAEVWSILENHCLPHSKVDPIYSSLLDTVVPAFGFQKAGYITSRQRNLKHPCVQYCILRTLGHHSHLPFLPHWCFPFFQYCNPSQFGKMHSWELLTSCGLTAMQGTTSISQIEPCLSYRGKGQGLSTWGLVCWKLHQQAVYRRFFCVCVVFIDWIKKLPCPSR